MGDVQADQFTQLGTHSQQTSTANLKLDCDADANINVTLTGTQNPDTADDSVLELSNQGDDKVAAGIGVQLLYNDTPLELNKMLNLKRSAGDQESFPITARYIQTKDKVRAGQANATATLNLTYQ
nr:fimbrial protein [Citrobacter amalonaticus]